MSLRLHISADSLKRRLQLPTVGLLIVLIVSAVTAQQEYPVFSAQQLETAMKTMGLGFELVKRALAKGDVENAKDYLPRSREQLATSITFWRHNQKDDAVKLLRATLKAMDDLDATLSAESVDSTAVTLNVRRVDAACEACHAVYREQDSVTKAFRLKAGSME